MYAAAQVFSAMTSTRTLVLLSCWLVVFILLTDTLSEPKVKAE